MFKSLFLFSAIIHGACAFNPSALTQAGESATVVAVPYQARMKAAASVRSGEKFAGRYTDGEDYVVYFEVGKQGLVIRPALWTAKQLLVPRGADHFVVVDRPEREASFHRDAQGQVVGVTIRGFDGEERKLFRAGRELLLVELLLSGKGREAARAYLSKGVNDVNRFVRLGERVLNGHPSMPDTVVGFLSEAASRFPDAAELHTLLGYAYVAAGDRNSAINSFQRAYTLQPTNKDALSGLARLNRLPPAASSSGVSRWTIPFSLNSVFEKPNAAEIRQVEADWRRRDLRPRDVKEVASGLIDLGGSKATVRIVSHLVEGSRHFGAIIVPVGAKPGCCPIVIEAKGVSWNYFPLELEKLNAPRLMAKIQQRFIYVIPSFRGEVLNYAGTAYQSEGDRTDALDGATDDTIALLNVALQTTPEADGSRICAFGHSRGGTVALLTGIRDRRVSCVVEWAGPTDWFELMGTGGWTEQELYAEGLRTRAGPSETGGQNIERFLLKAIRGEETLFAVRRRMLASSPLYFARRLPRVQLHYGEEDSSVPARNGRALAARLRLRTQTAPRFEAHFYPGAGHDTDRIVAPILTRQFLTESLLKPTTRQKVKAGRRTTP
ncbi:MAG TPA: prolyl oligopeptidase family serine peptidase [Pyrinomonadaceae bacterium]|nr:prolyl oligopeptidase family serine peptidase [Pyrinomonadaceae bacterium]